MVSLSATFSKLNVLEPFELTETKVLAQLCHVFARNSEFVTLWCPAQRTTEELLWFVNHHTPTHCHVVREFLQQLFRCLAGSHCQHVVHMYPRYKCPVLRIRQTNMGSRSSLVKPCYFNLFDKCSCHLLGDVRNPNTALRSFHTTRLPSCRSFGVRPSGGCTYSCSPSRTSALRKACV